GADIVQARQLREALEAEDTLEERRRAIAGGAAGAGVPAGLCDEPACPGGGDGRVRGAAADSRGVRPRTGPRERADRGRLASGAEATTSSASTVRASRSSGSVGIRRSGRSMQRSFLLGRCSPAPAAPEAPLSSGRASPALPATLPA